jgi:cytochrome c-type biogenesis protein CcmH
MTFWVLSSLLVALAIGFCLWPLIWGGERAGALEDAIALYEAQKAELIHQRERGAITPEECEAALAERGRRLIALDRSNSPRQFGDPKAVMRRKSAALLMLCGVPVLSIALYLRIGTPAMPDLPLAWRDKSPQNIDMVTALQKIEAHLAKNPNDGRGYEVVAPVYLKSGRFADAVHAYSKVLELLGETPARLADLGESLVAEADGAIRADARKAFERSAAMDPAFAKPRFYLALAREQDGDLAGAFAELHNIREALPEGPSRMRVETEIDRFRVEHPAVTGRDAAGGIASLPAADREAAIRGMVDALEARLFDKGGSSEEWRRLIQSRMVLGQREAAEAALERARKALSGDPAAAPMIDALADAIKSVPSGAQ